MAVNNELAKPGTEDEFESMCFQLYRRLWTDNTSMRMGGSGQAQFGIDILGHDGRQAVGIQCKHYNRTPFTLATVRDDLKHADAANLRIGHLLFATTAASKSALVLEIQNLSEERRARGQFTVSVDFWGAISDHIRMHPEVGRAFIPGFPGGIVQEILEVTKDIFAAVAGVAEQQGQFREQMRLQVAEVVRVLPPPDARGDEADPGVVVSLDFIRDRLRAGMTEDARTLLMQLGNPSLFRDQFSKFRWHTNLAAVDMQDGKKREAAEGYLKAFLFAPENEKALANRAHAYLVQENYPVALAACEEGLARYPNSALIWPLKIAAREKLLDNEPEAGVPKEIWDTPDVLFARAALAGNRKDHAAAFALWKRCLAEDANSLEAKRFLLVEALSACSVRSITAMMGQITDENRANLIEALEYFEPVESFLQTLQSSQISDELSVNLTSALMVLGHQGRARNIAATLLHRHPFSEGLLRIRLQDLEESEKIVEIKSLTSGLLNELPPVVLCILAEISANKGDVGWNTEILRVAELRSDVEPRLKRVQVLKFHALWVSGKKDEALGAASKYAAANQKNVLAQSVVALMLHRVGKDKDAVAYANACYSIIQSDWVDADAFHAGDLLLSLRQFEKSAEIFGKLVSIPGDDELTHKWVASLVQSGQRKIALDVFNDLPTCARNTSRFRQVEINLHMAMGNWAKMRDLLAIEIAERPKAGDVAVGYVSALFRLNEKDQYENYLNSDPEFDDASDATENEFAKYQVQAGFSALAIERLFRIFKRKPSSPTAAGMFLGQVLLSRETSLFSVPPCVGPGCAVEVTSSSTSWWIAIDDASTKDVSWPEMISSSSATASALLGLKLGDQAAVRRGFLDEVVTVSSVVSLYFFAVNKAHEVIGASADPVGPLWSVKAVKDDGKFEFELFYKDALARQQHMRSVFAQYSARPFPISILAQLLKTDAITLFLEWPAREARLFVGVGGHAERDAALTVLRQRSEKRCVLDLLTIAELYRHGVLGLVHQYVGRPLIPERHREQLLVLLQDLGSPRESATLGMSDRPGRLQLTQIPVEYFHRRSAFISALLEYIDDKCEVVPVAGPREITDLHRSLVRTLDASTLDAVYLAIERDAVLLTEDGALRGYAMEAGVQQALGIQSLLVYARSKKGITQRKYTSVMGKKFQSRHNFISIGSADLIEMARYGSVHENSALHAAISSFRLPTLDIKSGLNVAFQFIDQAPRCLPAETVGVCVAYLLHALVGDRDHIASEVLIGAQKMLRRIYGRNGRRIRPYQRRAFGGLLSRL